MSPTLTPADLAELGKRALPRKSPRKAPGRHGELKSPGGPVHSPPKRPEGALVKELVRALRALGVVAVRQNVGAVQTGRRFIRFGLPGCSDILGIIPVPCPWRTLGVGKCWSSCPGCEGRGTVGLALAVEVKSADGQLRPAQEAFLGLVNASGGLGLVARSVDDVVPLVMRRMGQR